MCSNCQKNGNNHRPANVSNRPENNQQSVQQVQLEAQQRAMNNRTLQQQNPHNKLMYR